MMVANFRLDSSRIPEARARRRDTDFRTVSIVVGHLPAISRERAMGDLGNGARAVGLADAATLPGDVDVPVVRSHPTLNTGHSEPGGVRHGVEAVPAAHGRAAAHVAKTAAVGDTLGALIGTAVVPLFGSALGAPMRFGCWRISAGPAGSSIADAVDNLKVTVWRR